MKAFGMTIDGKHTSEFGLRMLSMSVPLPDVNETLVDVPGMSGQIDLTEVLTGYPTYTRRKNVTFTFKMYTDWNMYEKVKTELAEWIHGRKVKIVLDNDIAYYYICRLSVDVQKSNRLTGTVTLKGSADPMKYEITSSDEEWLWDPLDFDTGVIRELSDIVIEKDKTAVVIAAGEYSVSPTFIVESSLDLTVEYNGYTYPLPVGKTKIPAIRVGNEEVTLLFNGQGKLSIDYRGERL